MKKLLKKVIVAVSGRMNALHAAMYAIMMSKTYGVEIKFVYVVDTETIKVLSMNRLLITEEKDGFEKKLRENGENYLHYVQMLASKKGVEAKTEMRSGAVFTEILKAADEYEADLIILGGSERDKDGLAPKKSFINRDENDVLVNAHKPVMIIQDPEIETMFKNF